MSKIKRLDLYLQQANAKQYENTDVENALVDKFNALFLHAKGAQDEYWAANPKNLEKWRKAYLSTLNALNIETGEESKKKSRQLRKVCFEMVESKIDNSIPMVKMKPRYKSDLHLVDVTENYLKFSIDDILTRYLNDKSERSTYIDGTSWYKISWDSFDSTHDRSGDVKLEIRTVDQVYPQPGVNDYKKLEYIFECTKVSTTRIFDLYGRLITATDGKDNLIDVVSCYYLNEKGIVGLFSYCKSTLQVICNEEDWQIRKVRVCTKCGTINPTDETCRNCGNDKFKYENSNIEVLSEDLVQIDNPYDSESEELTTSIFASAGTQIPFYVVRQLPFVPRPAISIVDSIYGISEVKTTLDEQDAINKILTKSVDKTLKSGAVVTKPEKMKIGDTDDTIKLFGVRSSEEAQMVQSKQIVADTSQDMALGAILYDNAKSASGITDSFQGKKDSTATSGKAKQYAAAQSAGRIQSLREMKMAAFAGIYELVFKYLLAFSDEKRNFVKILPDGTEEEMTWNKYMFLAKDNHGKYYYRDDFSFGTDNASTLTQDREALWQETTSKLVQGAFGNPGDPRTLKLYWNMMNMLQYPLAKVVINGIKENEQHLPPELEQAIMSNPEIMQTIAGILQNSQSNQGGARVGAGQKGNGATHSANVEKTNAKNKALNKSQIVPNQQGGNISANI